MCFVLFKRAGRWFPSHFFLKIVWPKTRHPAARTFGAVSFLSCRLESCSLTGWRRWLECIRCFTITKIYWRTTFKSTPTSAMCAARCFADGGGNVQIVGVGHWWKVIWLCAIAARFAIRNYTIIVQMMGLRIWRSLLSVTWWRRLWFGRFRRSGPTQWCLRRRLRWGVLGFRCICCLA